MKKMVMRIEIDDEKGKSRMFKLIAGFPGVDSVSFDMKEKKVTVIGDADPVYLMNKLKKYFSTEFVSVGPAKEVSVGSSKEVSVGSAKDEKSHSVKTKTADAPKIVYVPPPLSDKYRSYEYGAWTDENPNACGIS